MGNQESMPALDRISIVLIVAKFVKKEVIL